MTKTLLAAMTGLLMAGAAAAPPDLEALTRQVADTERAFARSMAERDHAAFTKHLSEQAVFFGAKVLNGKPAVAAAWKRFFEAKEAPFSWEPDQVEVLASGDLALSTGLVKNPAGTVTGRFNSIWQRQSDGRWQVIFDKGGPP